MTFKSACLTSTALLILSISGVNAGETTNDAGAIVCVNDKWDEKEVEKGHKLVDAVQRCVIIPNDPALPKFVSDCVGKYEYISDPPQLARLDIGSLPSLTEEFGERKRYSLIVFVRDKSCEQLWRAIEFVVGHRVGCASVA